MRKTEGIKDKIKLNDDESLEHIATSESLTTVRHLYSTQLLRPSRRSNSSPLLYSGLPCVLWCYPPQLRPLNDKDSHRRCDGAPPRLRRNPWRYNVDRASCSVGTKARVKNSGKEKMRKREVALVLRKPCSPCCRSDHADCARKRAVLRSKREAKRTNQQAGRVMMIEAFVTIPVSVPYRT